MHLIYVIDEKMLRMRSANLSCQRKRGMPFRTMKWYLSVERVVRRSLKESLTRCDSDRQV